MVFVHFWLSIMLYFFNVCESALLEYVCVCITCIPGALWKASWIPWNWLCRRSEAAMSAGNPAQSLTKAPSALSHGAASTPLQHSAFKIHPWVLALSWASFVSGCTPLLYRLICWGILAVCSFWISGKIFVNKIGVNVCSFLVYVCKGKDLTI